MQGALSLDQKEMRADGLNLKTFGGELACLVASCRLRRQPLHFPPRLPSCFKGEPSKPISPVLA